METLSVRCNHCGAPLEVGAQTRFLTCQFCHSPLEVKRTDTAVFTEEVARIAEKTRQMAGHLQAIELQNEIERLDREWTVGAGPRPGHAGRVMRPARRGNAIFSLLFTVFFAVVCFSMATVILRSHAHTFMALVPAGMGLFALAAGISNVLRSQSSKIAHQQYLEQRQILIRQLESLREK